MTIFGRVMQSVHPDIDKSNFVMRLPNLLRNEAAFINFKMGAMMEGYNIKIGHLGDLHIYK